MLGVWCNSKLQALVYDILPSRKVPESDVRSVVQQQTPSTGLRHPSFKEGAGKRCSECAQGIGAVWVVWGTDRKCIYIWLFVDCIIIGLLLLLLLYVVFLLLLVFLLFLLLLFFVSLFVVAVLHKFLFVELAGTCF